MLKLAIKPHWFLVRSNATHSLPHLIELLQAVEAKGSIAAGAAELGVSYRHAWGLVRLAGREFGAPLLDMRRGKRAKLSVLGEKLVAADRRINARIAPLLDSLASELESELVRSRTGATDVVRIHASHGYAIELMRGFLLRRNVPVDLRYRGSMEALASFAGGNCELAGFHAPIGDLQGPMLEFYSKWLDPQDQVLIHVATRRQGIMVATGNPKHVEGLSDFARPGLRFVNRQFGAGTRILLELLLKREGIDSATISGYDTGEFTHSAVAACIASGLADVGFGVEVGAREFKLDFIPVLSERYFLVCRRAALRTSAIRRIVEVLSGKPFRVEAAALPGVDVTDAGTILPLGEAFPELSKGRSARAGQPADRAL